MESGRATHELTRLAAAYLTSISFGIAFLVASLAGVDGLTALLRAACAAGAAWLASWFLVPPVIGVVLAALVRDEARRRKEDAAEEDA
jgi:hypothetical protein